MKKFCMTLVLSVALFCTASMGGCGRPANAPNPRNPVIVTMWHNFGGVMKEAMDSLIDEFNTTIGRDEGVSISVTSISASKEQNDSLLMIARGDPGRPEMPDLVTAYPGIAVTLRNSGPLAAFDAYFTDAELDAYLPQFVEEGRLDDGNLYVFPVSKSTEALYVNKTFFDRFSAETGVSWNCFDTFEGIAEASAEYFAWSGGKTFYIADSWFNMAMVGMAQQNNMRFIAETGYLHVTAAAFGERMTDEIENVENDAIKKLLTVATEMYRSYDFIVAPNQGNITDLQNAYEAAIKAAMRRVRAAVQDGANAEAVSEELYKGFSIDGL
ncbi:MAG: extracellular solute-binding protein [Clostridiales bacterium]|nr:extracellular solute-binding protein [Clostridiales bacterium]